MSDAVEFPRGPWVYQHDSFDSERNSFEEDAHMLILSIVDAGIKNLYAEAQKQDDDLTPHIQNATSAALERIGELQQDIWGYIGAQERFARNIGLVALISRLIHSLNVMARSAQDLGARNPKGYSGEDEFKQLWNEYAQRFGITFSAKHIQFIEPLRAARNMIVHKGGAANPPKAFEDIDLNSGDEGLYDLRFSNKYPKFVKGEGYSAEVVISEKQLEDAVKSATYLVRYVATELRKREFVLAKQEEEAGLWDDYNAKFGSK